MIDLDKPMQVKLLNGDTYPVLWHAEHEDCIVVHFDPPAGYEYVTFFDYGYLTPRWRDIYPGALLENVPEEEDEIEVALAMTKEWLKDDAEGRVPHSTTVQTIHDALQGVSSVWEKVMHPKKCRYTAATGDPWRLTSACGREIIHEDPLTFCANCGGEITYD